ISVMSSSCGRNGAWFGLCGKHFNRSSLSTLMNHICPRPFIYLLCSPSQHRTDILAWICTTQHRLIINVIIFTEMASFGQELMLCKATDVDLIRVRAQFIHKVQKFKVLHSDVKFQENQSIKHQY
uniref:Uncharacterized protein n=1 Tax=Neogobius melanostomus TaxID=47308 RepID=A0A8C6SKN0_9GOBI